MKVGAARVDITPPLGVELSGYGYFLDRRAERVLDRLYTRAVYIETEQQKALVLSSDLVGIDPWLTETTRTLCARYLGLPPEAVLIAATHTHSGPAAGRLFGCGAPDRLYFESLPYRWIEAAQKAASRAWPATVALNCAPYETFGINRNDPDGPKDQEIRVARFDVDGRPAAVLVNHAVHAVVYGRENRGISGDWPGEAARCIEAALGRGTEDDESAPVCLFLQGAAGTTNPRRACLGTDEGRLVCEEYGEEFGFAALDLLMAADPEPESEPESGGAALRCKRAAVELPLRQYARDELLVQCDKARAALEGLPEEEQPHSIWRLRLGVYERWLHDARWERRPAPAAELQVIAANALRIVGIPGELFPELGDEILDSREDGLSFLACYANHWLGYFPSREAFRDKRFNYPVNDAPFLAGLPPFEPDVGERIVAAACALVDAV